MKKLEWKTINKRVDDLAIYENNPRKITNEQLEVLKKSLDKFNYVELVAIDADGTVVAGSQRIRALQLLGRGNEEIPVRICNRKLTKNEFKEYLITSNKSGGTWDEIILFDNFETDLLLESGFDQEEITNLFSEILDTEDDGFDVDRELKKIGKPKSKLGDLYQLGPHRLLAEDSTDPKIVQRVVGEQKIDMIYCDPPFNTKLDYDKGIGGTQRYGGTVDDNKSEAEYRSFLQKTMENALAVSNDDVHIFYFCDETYIPLIATLYRDLEIDFRRVCIWLKGIANPTPQVAFSKVFEACIYGTRNKPYLSPNHRNFDEVLNKDIGTGNAMIENFMDMISVWAVQRLAGNQYSHPTEKPITLHDKPIRRCTKVGDNILSLFGGSGGELLAAHQLKRNCFMVETNPIFVDLIIRRYEAFTGDKAKRISQL